MTETSIRKAGVYRIDRPDRAVLPLIFGSPHSGTHYPEDFEPVVPREAVMACAALYVNRLFAAAPDKGAVLMTAEFPRVYIDPNRAIDDIDAKEFSGLTAPCRPSEKTRLGQGLIWNRAKPDGAALYHAPLGADAVTSRIDRFYKPYHDALAALIDSAHAALGHVYHVSCHSMSPLSGVMDIEGLDIARADIVLSDRMGASCETGFLKAARQSLRKKGLEVAVNTPFKGAELIHRHGNPTENRHALQIAVNRRLYLNLQSLEPNARFAETKAAIDDLIDDLVAYVGNQALAARHKDSPQDP